MPQYLELKENDIREILLKYDLELSGHEFIEVGSGNTNYLVSSVKGKYILTLFEIGFLRTEKLVRLLYLLEKHKFPTNRILKSADGDEMTRFRGKAVLLKPYISGKAVKELNDDMLSQVGAAIAKLNEIPAPDYMPEHHAYGLETFSRVMDKGINLEYENLIEEKYKLLKKTIPTGLPRGLIHGDVFFDNVLFEGTEFKALIDFEEACIYYKIFDLGMAVVGLCTEGPEIILPNVRSLVKGYQTIRILEGIEKEILQLFVEYAALATSSWRFWKYNIDTPIVDMSERYLGMVNIAKATEAISNKVFMKEVFECQA